MKASAHPQENETRPESINSLLGNSSSLTVKWGQSCLLDKGGVRVPEREAERAKVLWLDARAGRLQQGPPPSAARASTSTNHPSAGLGPGSDTRK